MTGTNFEDGMYYLVAAVTDAAGISTLVVPTDVNALLGGE
jgi:hypothetical protein